MTPELVLHPRTLEEAQAFLQNPTHALLISGPLGGGKQALALWLAGQLLGLSGEALTSYPYLLVAAGGTSSISIETIREQQQFMRLKTIGTEEIRRIAVLPDAGRMTLEAQNAFLKILEEPPADTVLLLTVANQHDLLPTILSRTQHLPVRHAAEPLVTAYFGERFAATAVERAYLLSAGLPGLMTALLEQDKSHPLAQAIEQAKVILRAPNFERLAMVDALSKQKSELQPLLQALKQIAQTGLLQASSQADTARLSRWYRTLKATHQAQTALEKSANPKLLLTNLMLTL